ncbi:MAG: carbonic anhydrase family protein [Spirochaetaceae bacterium]|jgi:carbonic anhydrase|nr:carbonic anhydrase family protein [Spirochaetaceae bacterium]
MTFNKHRKWLLPLLFAGLALFQIGCKSAQKPAEEPQAQEEKHWGYAGDVGPEFWADLNPEYALARDGKAQSPIDIVTDALSAEGAPAKPEFHYAGVSFKAENNGHTVELVPADETNYIVLDGVNYALKQAHFHAPSEHTINGEPAAMEVHLVHQDAEGGIGVVGFLIASGAENEIFKEAFANLPQEEGAETELEEPIDLTALTAAANALYRYDGSLTTPPCSEGVKWSVSDTVIEMSQDQIDAFTALYPFPPGNSRPVQSLNERLVYISQ